MIDFFRRHPLLAVLVLAALLRLPAVFLSQGFMASDDHFETIEVSYSGIKSGLLNDSGLLRWNAVPPEKIGRSPLYVLFLYSQMYLLKQVGISDLDSMMYFIRLIHALISLLIIYYGYRYIQKTIGDGNYALLAGLILAGHFLMPFLAVRNLIEQVSAAFLLPALFFAERGWRENNSRLLLLAGMLGALSWMIRFQVGIALLPVPFVLWYLARNFRPALYFSAGAAIGFLFSASLDMIYLGGFARSTINILHTAFFGAGAPPLPQPFWFFLVLPFLVFIPPFSLFFIFSFFNRENIRKHLLLLLAAGIFILIHSFFRHKEERFLIPVFPLLVLMGVAGLQSFRTKSSDKGWLRYFFKISVGIAVAINIILLPLAVSYYGHKGLVAPLVYIEKQPDLKRVLIDHTEGLAIVPYVYAGEKAPVPIKIDTWDVLGSKHRYYDKFDSINYFIIYADTNLQTHLDSLQAHFGELQPVFHSPPTPVRYILHRLNPRHNRLEQAAVYKREI